jgi:hypothetical protein
MHIGLRILDQQAVSETLCRFVEEALDGGSVEALQELFWPGARRHFPYGDLVAGSEPPPRARAPDRTMKTDIHHLYGEGDLVTVHHAHRVTFGPGTRINTRAGAVKVGGKSVEWNAMAVFQFRDGRLAEEWVVRDELQVLTQLGVVQSITDR